MAFKIKNNPIGIVYDSPSEIKSQAIKWLSRIGVVKTDVEFDYLRSEGWAEISFVLNNKVYTFKSTKQNNFKKNLKAIEIFLHYRVINIERGVEEFETAFKGYQQLEYNSGGISSSNPYMGLSKKEIKQMMKIYHPDMENGDRAKFDQLRLALEANE